MARRLFTLLSALSLLLCAAAAVLWLLGSAGPTQIVVGPRRHSVVLYLAGGELEMGRAIYHGSPPELVGYGPIRRVQYVYVIGRQRRPPVGVAGLAHTVAISGRCLDCSSAA
jgi:hypothetical protein